MSQRPIYILLALIIIAGLIWYLTTGKEDTGRLSSEMALAADIEYCTDQEVCSDYNKRDGQIWCPNTPDCPADTCGCYLWRDKKGDGDRKWEKYGKPMEKMPYDDTYNHACWCTK